MGRPFLLICLLCLSTWIGAEELLILHTWCELEPMIARREPYPLPREEGYRLLLEEGRELYSAMIYGLEFSYIPSDRKRKIPESFTLEPMARIQWGDSSLRVTHLEERGRRLHATMSYRLADFQAARRQSWESNTLPLASGRGTSDLFQGPEEKSQALKEAIKNAIRNHLRPIRFNKPREIRGEVLLWQEPQTIIKSGTYLTQVTVKLRLTRFEPYRIF